MFGSFVPEVSYAACGCYSDINWYCPNLTPECRNPTTDPDSPQYIPTANERVSEGFSSLPKTSTNQPTGQTNGTNPTAFCSGGSCTYIPLEPLYGLPTSYGPNQGQGSFVSLIGNSFKLLIGAGGLVAIVMIVLGALTYMFSDIAGNKKKSLDRIRGAMWAIVLLVSSYLILVTINPDLVKFSLDLGIPDNYNTTPNLSGNATPDPIQVKPDQLQEGERKCSQQGGTLHLKSDGTYLCQ